MSKYEDFDGPDTPQDRFKTIEERRAENKDIEELLDRLDFNWIRAAYVRHMSKTAENVGKINFIPRDRVNIVFDMNAVAVFNAKENEIFIDPDSVRHGAYISGAPTSLFLLHDIVHEEGHAVSKILLAGDEVRQVGYGISVQSEREVNREYSAFEEGVTEKLTREVVEDYTKDHPEVATADGIERFQRMLRDESPSSIYALPMSLVEAMIAKISDAIMVPQEVVWGAIKRGKFEGENLGGGDLQMLFREMFSEEFLDKLKTVSHKNQDSEIAAMIEGLDLASLSPKLWERIKKRIDARTKLSR